MACTPGTDEPCYTGPSGTQDVGPCVAGARTCLEDGSGHGECIGEVVPVSETCNTLEDDDCDGETNEEGAGCVCLPQSVSACYTGPLGTDGVGLCVAGAATCDEQGTSLGACMGEVLPTFDNCTTPADEDCDTFALACTGNHLWSKGFGDAGVQQIRSVATDAAGNVLVTGSFQGTVDFGGGALTSGGANDVFVVKLDASGNHLWSKRFGDASAQQGASVATDTAGNVVVTGAYAGSADFGGGVLTSGGGNDVFVVKLDAAGNHLWSKRFGDAGAQQGAGVATDPAGNVLVTGAFAGSADFGGGALTSAGGTDVFVVKLDAAGDYLWSKRFGDAVAQQGTSLATDAAGSVLVTGSLAGATDFGGGTLTSAGGTDVFLVKLDAAGGYVWSNLFGNSAAQMGASVTTDATGSVLITGAFAGSINFGSGALTSAGGNDVFLAKFTAAGMHLWSTRFGNSSAQQGASVATDAGGNVVLTGDFAGSADFGGGGLASAGGSDVFVAKFDSIGTHLWSRIFGDAGNQFGTGIATDGAGNVVGGGDFAGTVDFGSGGLTSAGNTDFFVAKLTP